MHVKKALAILFAVMALTGLTYSAHANGGDTCAIKTPPGQTWLATGTITKVDGQIFYILGKDNQIYKIDAGRSIVLMGDSETERYVPKVGDIVRVYGVVDESCEVDAARIRVFKEPSEPAQAGSGPEPMVKIIIDKSATSTNPESCPIQAEPVSPANWESRGLITDVNYGGSQLKVQTSQGNYTINMGRATLTNGGGTRIGMGRLNLGDAVLVTGNLTGLNEIDAQSVRVTRTASEAQNALPMLPTSVVGVIQQIDYDSFTFKMATERSVIVVAADNDTIVQEQMQRMAFMDLRPGMRVKMSGNGSLATGYVAKHIQIISTAP
ncbi:MAG: DUF5666 domain-containing protein [Armatimonadota bacterium]|nr:DUF5666 domain-containing protein [bacterium]